MRSTLTLILFIGLGFCYGQELKEHFINYNVEQGLPSSQVYDMVEDEQGFLWFATDRGISKFNGYEFKNYTSNDGLAATSIFKFYKDHDSRIWCLGWVNRLSYVEAGEIHEYQYNQILEDSLPRAYQEVQMHLDKENNLHFFSMSNYCIISEEGEFQWIQKRYEDPYKRFRIHTHIVENRAISIKTAGWKEGEENKVVIFEKNREKAKIDYENVRLGVYTSLLNKDELYTLIDNRLIRIQGEQLEEITFDKRLIHLSLFDEQLFLGLYQGGGLFLNSQLEISKHILTQYSITSVMKDSQGGTWFSTLENGVLYFPRKRVLQEYSEVECVSIVQIGQEIVAAYSDGTIKHLENDSLRHTIDLSEQTDFATLYSIKFNELTGELNYCLSSTAENVARDIEKTGEFVWAQNVSQLNDSLVYTNVPYGILKYVNGSLDTIIRSDANIRCQVNYNSSIYIGSVHGLYELDGDTLVSRKDHPLFQERIHMMKPFNEHLLIGTLGAGLIICKEGQLQNMTTKDGLSSNDVTAIFAQDSNIWVGSNRGVDLIRFRNGKGVFIHNYKNLPSARINDIVVDDEEKIWLATSSGIKVVESDNKQVESNLYITEVTINGQIRQVQDEPVVLEHFENRIEFDFLALNFEASGNLGYQYRLLGFEEEWTFTNDRKINYLSLPPGEYTFEVMLQDSGVQSESNTASYKFEIKEAFWKSTTFFALCFFAGILFLILAFIYLRRRYALKARVVELKSQAIMLQISPHFIFNALNSIRKYVYENVEVADDYITRFAKLMRRILNSSSDRFTSISDELELLENYIILEQMRASKEFNYTIEVDPKINKDIDRIPNLIIQPFVENAIVHGILKKGGQLTIRFDKKGQDDIQCTIVDNCGGFDSSVLQPNRGSGITINRLNIISRKSNIHIDSSHILDSGERGTCITINFKLG